MEWYHVTLTGLYASRGLSAIAEFLFGKIGRIASENVLLQLLKLKCIRILLHDLEVCQLPRRNLQSLDHYCQ